MKIIRVQEESGSVLGLLTLDVEDRGQLKCDDTRRNQISSFGETDESI